MRHDADHLRLGLDTGPVVVVRDHPAVLPMLRAASVGDSLTALATIAGGTAGTERDETLEVAYALVRAGVLVDAPDTGPRSIGIADGPTTRALGAHLHATLTDAGLAVGAAGGTDDLVVVLGAAPSRERCRALVRAGRPHLVVSVEAAYARVGPFVVPGSTACLDCVDADRREWDAGWSAALVQLDRPVLAVGGDVPADAAARCGLAGHVAEQVLAWARGHEPTTADHVLEIGPHLSDVARSAAEPDPRCGCRAAAADQRPHHRRGTLEP